MRVEKAKVESYKTFLAEPTRPPSRGGDTRAWHSHSLHVDGERYSFLALGSRKWVFVGDVVSFDWDWDDSRRYRNVDPASVRTWDKKGEEVFRGNRGTKRWRTAPARLPASVREQRD